MIKKPVLAEFQSKNPDTQEDHLAGTPQRTTPAVIAEDGTIIRARIIPLIVPIIIPMTVPNCATLITPIIFPERVRPLPITGIYFYPVSLRNFLQGTPYLRG
jgi:hypothetical protein